MEEEECDDKDDKRVKADDAHTCKNSSGAAWRSWQVVLLLTIVACFRALALLVDVLLLPGGAVSSRTPSAPTSGRARARYGRLGGSHGVVCGRGNSCGMKVILSIKF